MFPNVTTTSDLFSYSSKIRSPSQWQLSDSCLSLLCSDSTYLHFGNAWWVKKKNPTSCPIMIKHKGNWHKRNVIGLSKARPVSLRLSFHVFPMPCASGRCCSGCSKEQKRKAHCKSASCAKFSAKKRSHLINKKLDALGTGIHKEMYLLELP